MWGLILGVVSGWMGIIPATGIDYESIPGPVSTVSIAPASGQWPTLFTANLALNNPKNRIVTLVRNSAGVWFATPFDASTNGFSTGAATRLGVGARPLGSRLSTEDQSLWISWGDAGASLQGSERESPIGLERFNLETFSASDSVLFDMRFHRFDLDPAGGRLVGIAEPSGDEDGYMLRSLGLDPPHLESSASIGIATSEAIARDAVYNASNHQLLVLMLPTLPGEPNQIEPYGYVVSVDGLSGSVVTRSATFSGEFTPHSLALSPDSGLLAVVPWGGNGGQVPVLDASTLTIASTLDESLASPKFQSNGTGLFIDATTLWIPNSSETTPEETIAVFDASAVEWRGFIEDASETEIFEIDREAGRVFAGSQSLQQVHILSTTSTAAATHIDIAVRPFDLEVDPVDDAFALLSRTGRLHRVSEFGPQYLGRFLDFAVKRDSPVGFRRSMGILVDSDRRRLFVGRQAGRPPTVLNAVDLSRLADLPTAADAVAFDASRNLIYTVGFPYGASLRRTLWEIDGQNYTVLREFPLRVGASAIDPPTEMKVDQEGRKVWMLTRSFARSGLLERVDLDSGAIEVHSFDGHPTLGPLILDAERDRVLVGVQPTEDAVDASLAIFPKDASPLEPAEGSIDLDARFLLDHALDSEHDLAYFLVLHRSEPLPRLVVLDLLPDSILAGYRIEQIREVDAARMAFNPTTNRFALVGGVGDSMYLFDNPVDPSRRPPPEPTVPAFLPASVEINPTTFGIELSWALNPSLPDLLKGVIVERRDGENVDWIRLTPLPLPATLNRWTDVTVEPGVEHRYRLRTVGDIESASGAFVSALVSMPASNDGWRPSIPEVVVQAAPGDSLILSLLVRSSLPSRDSLISEVETVSPLSATVTPVAIFRPGIGTIQVGIPEETPDGVYPLTAIVRDASVEARVSTLIQVSPADSTPTEKRIPRTPTLITLSSDSDLNGRRHSIRGQLATLRELAQPVPVHVRAVLPDGRELHSTVVSSTGEFTADFESPKGAPSGGWTVTAVFPGSVEWVGGVSRPFNVPIQTEADGKGGLDAEYDPGRIVIAAGSPPRGDDEADLQRWVEAAFRTFSRNRFKQEYQQIESSPTSASLKSAIQNAAEESERYVLLYILSDAVKVGEKGVQLRLREDEHLTAVELGEALSGIVGEATPLVVIDCPFAGRFAEELGRLAAGAFIFSAHGDFSRVSFSEDRIPFSDLFLSQMEKGRGFGQALADVAPFFSFSSSGMIDSQRPEGRRVDEEPYWSLPLGSHLTPSRSLLPDRIPPEFIEIAPFQTVALGGTVHLEARVEDYPFGDVQSVEAWVTHPDGHVHRIALGRTGEGGRFTGEVALRVPGEIQILYRCDDDAGNFQFERSTARAPGWEEGRFDSRDLLAVIASLGGALSIETSKSGHPVQPHPLFGGAILWFRALEGGDR